MTLTPEEKAYLFAGWESEESCAHMLGISQRALAGLRRKGLAPPHIRLTKRGAVLYPSEGIDDFLRDIWLNSPKPEPETEKIEEL